MAVGLDMMQLDETMEEAETVSQKSVKIVSTAFAFLIFTVYCSLLTSSMTLAQKLPPIMTFEDMFMQVNFVTYHFANFNVKSFIY